MSETGLFLTDDDCLLYIKDVVPVVSRIGVELKTNLGSIQGTLTISRFGTTSEGIISVPLSSTKEETKATADLNLREITEKFNIQKYGEITPQNIAKHLGLPWFEPGENINVTGDQSVRYTGLLIKVRQERVETFKSTYSRKTHTEITDEIAEILSQNGITLESSKQPKN